MTNSSDRIKELCSRALAATDPAQIDPPISELKTALRDKILHQQSWMALCERAAVEQDPKKLLELISEINRLFDSDKESQATAPDGGSAGNLLR
jgi:hypothetical protein